jgi:hypothetical protein
MSLKAVGFRTSSEANNLSFVSSFAISDETSRSVIMGRVDRDLEGAIDRVHFPSERRGLENVRVIRIVF